MNGGIEDVKSRLLPQLKDVDQIVIAHQITDNRIAEDEGNFPKNVVYCASYEP